MKRLLLPLLAALALPVHAGIPESRVDKWALAPFFVSSFVNNKWHKMTKM